MSSNDEITELKELLNKALEMLYKNDMSLIKRSTNERTITSRFARYFEDLVKTSSFKDLDVDVEYNRNGTEPKRTNSSPNGTFPDVLLHRRKSNNENKLVIEFKCYWSQVDDVADKRKLIDFTSVNDRYKYRLGAFVMLEETFDDVITQYFENGELVHIGKQNNLITSSEWSTLEEVADVIDSLHKTPTYSEFGLPMVRATDVRYGDLNLTQSIKVNENTFVEFSRRYKPTLNDIIITRVGVNYGTTTRVKNTGFCLGQNIAAIVPKKIDPRYLYAVLNSKLIWKQIKAVTVGSTQATLSLKAINALKIPRFDKNSEDTIAAILSALDDRITLLRETNATLEAIAQALFKSWFVDFDPVHAKMQGSQPEGMDEQTAALFPDSFEESELGLVPAGWKVARFEEFITRIPVGKKYDQKTALLTGEIPILDQGKSGIIGYHNDCAGVNSSLEKPVVVFANHTCYMRLITFPFSAIQNVLPFKGRNVETVWAYYATKDRVTFSEYKGHYPEFAIEKAILPSKELTTIFKTTIFPLLERTRLNEVQLKTLADLRDTLLPRLISGQLRVGDVDATT